MNKTKTKIISYSGFMYYNIEQEIEAFISNMRFTIGL